MQAVIVIHGMGEQIPMGTLNGFVDAVWTKDESLTNRNKPNPNTGKSRKTGPVENAAWYKPDEVSRNFELRRITTEKSAPNDKNRGRRTDFYEFYWAHHIKDMTFKDVLSWIRYLLFRNPLKSVPKDVLFTWCLLWIITLGTLGYAIHNALPTVYTKSVGFLPDGLLPALTSSILGIIASFAAVAIGGFITKNIVSHFGDVVRYVRPQPPNISTRQKIREEGVKLLESILSEEYSGKKKYDRVVVVAHSLGTIVAYDILTHAFARMNTKYTAQKDKAENALPPFLEPERAKLEEMIRQGNLSVEDYQSQQNKAMKELVAQGNAWCVSDFITIGSPLTHAEFLLEKDMGAVRKAQLNRTFPTCPPAMEYDGKTNKKRFTYTGSFKDKNSPYNRYIANLKNDDQKYILKEGDKAPRYPHHAALFAYTRWSNLYSPSKLTLWGDQVSGPLGNAFGNGIRDIQVMPGLDEKSQKLKGERTQFLAHTKYWSFDKKLANTPHKIKILRDVLDLSEG